MIKTCPICNENKIPYKNNRYGICNECYKYHIPGYDKDRHFNII